MPKWGRSLTGLGLCFTIACGEGGDKTDPQPFELPLPPLTTEAGYVELESVRYRVGEPLTDLAAAPARLFYSLHPADSGVSSPVPLCVLFNGGPGVGSELLLEDLGPRRFASQEPNPASFTGVCHELFLDARNTGLSYMLTDPETPYAFDIANHNPFLDAADTLRAVLRIMQAHPKLWESPVIWVAESYASVRVTVATHLLLFLSDYRENDAFFQDPALMDELDRHSVAWLGPLDAESLASRFGRQVLIQPSIAADLRDRVAGEMLDGDDAFWKELEAQTGLTYSPCPEDAMDCDAHARVLDYLAAAELSAYDTRQPDTYLETLLDRCRSRVGDWEAFSALLGTNLTNVSGLGATERQGAQRLVTPDAYYPALPEWDERLGALGPLDRYFITLHTRVFQAFARAEGEALQLDWHGNRYGLMFLETLSRMHTFLTRARYDLVGYSAALPEVLRQLSPDVAVEFLETSNTEARPGALSVRYEATESSPIRWPLYEAGHTVAHDQGPELLSDVTDWLLEQQ